MQTGSITRIACASTLLLAALSPATAAQIKYVAEGTGNAFIDRPTLPDITLQAVTFRVEAIGDTDIYTDDLAFNARFIPITNAVVTFTGAFGSVSPDLAPVPVGSDRVFASGFGIHNGKVAFGILTGGVPDLGSPLYSDDLLGYDGISSIGPVAASVEEVDFAIANGNSWYFTNLGNVSFTAQVLTDAVPEAPTWAMLILGFGLIGHSLRRRREVAA